MHARLRVALGVAAACAIALAVAVAVAGHGGSGSLGLVGGFAGAQRPDSIPPEDFVLRDEDGRPVHLRDYAGRVVVVTFLASTCRTACPVIAQQIRGALDQLGHGVPALAVSVDPANDTRLSARRFLLAQSMLGRMSFLLGSAAQLGPVWRAFGIQPQIGSAAKNSDHTAYVVLIDRSGRQRIGFPDSALTPEALAHDIRALELERPPALAPRRVLLG